nr:trichohyalin-like isoform X3 [Procambarus clarkii]
MTEAQRKFMRSARQGDLSGVQRALDQGRGQVQVNGVDQEASGRGRVALHHASEGGHLQVVHLLLQAGADLNIHSKKSGDQGGTALHLAAEAGHTHVMEALLQSHANPEALDDKGRRAIHWAAYTGQLKSLEMLKDYKCDLHALDHEGSSALHLAAAFGDLEVVKWLVQNKVSCDLRDHRNRLPKDVARARGLVDVHHFLKQHTAKLSFSWGRARSRTSLNSEEELSQDKMSDSQHDPPAIQEDTSHHTRKEERRTNENEQEARWKKKEEEAKKKREEEEEAARKKREAEEEAKKMREAEEAARKRREREEAEEKEFALASLKEEVNHQLQKLERERLQVAAAQERLKQLLDQDINSDQTISTLRQQLLDQKRTNDQTVSMLRQQLSQVTKELEQIKQHYLDTQNERECRDNVMLERDKEEREAMLKQDKEQREAMLKQDKEQREMITALQEQVEESSLKQRQYEEALTHCEYSQLREQEETIRELLVQEKLLKQANDDINTKILQMYKRSEHHEESAARLQEELRAKEREIEEQVTNHQRTEAALRGELQTMAQELEHLQEERVKLQVLQEQDKTNRQTIATLTHQLNLAARRQDEDSRRADSDHSEQKERVKELLEQEKLNKKNTEELKKSIYQMSLRLGEQEETIETYKEKLLEKERALKESEEQSLQVAGALKEEADQLKRRLDKAQEALREHEMNSKNIEEELNSSIQRMSSQLREQEEAIDAYKSQLSNKGREVEEAEEARRQKTAALRQEVDRLSQKLDDERLKATSVQSQLEERVNDLQEQERLSKKITEELKNSVQHMSEKLTENVEIIESLKEELQEKERDSEERDSEHQQTVAALREELESLEQQLEHLQLQQEEGQQEAAQQELTNKGIISELQDKLQERLERLQEAENIISSYQVQLRNKDKQLEQREKASEESVALLKEKIQTLSNMLEDEHKKVAAAQAQEEELGRLQQLDVTNRKTISSLKEQLAHLTRIMNQETEQAQGLQKQQQNRIQELLRQIDVFKKIINDLNATSEAKDQKMREYEKIISTDQVQLREARQQLEEGRTGRSQETVTMLREKVDLLARNLAAMQEAEREQREQNKVHLLNIEDMANKLKEFEKAIRSYKVREIELLEQDDVHRTNIAEMNKKLKEQEQTIRLYQQKQVDEVNQRSEGVTADQRVSFSRTQEVTPTGRDQQEATPTRRDHSGPHWRSDISLRVASPSGLPNLGNTCYINSVVQCLFNINSFRDYFIRDSYRRDLNRDSDQRGEVASSIAQLFKALHSGIENEVSERSKLLKRVVSDHDDDFRGSNQHDAHHLLVVLLTWLHDDLKNSAGTSLIARRLHGENTFVTICDKHGKEISRTSDVFSVLSLPVPPSTTCSLQDLLISFYKRKNVDRECSYCRRSHMCRRETSLTNLPPVLIVHLRRYTGQAGEPERKTWVTFPADGLNLQDYAHNYRSPTYELFAVVNHEGSAASGHYTTFCRNQHGKTWRLYDDDLVTETSLETALEESEAQLLFYTEKR